MSERCVLAGLVVEEERLVAVEAAATPEELDRVDAFYGAARVLAESPVFCEAFLVDWDAWRLLAETDERGL